MDAPLLGRLILSILIWTFYILLPAATILRGIITICRKKKIIQKQGKMEIEIKTYTGIPFALYFIFLAAIIGVLVFFIIHKETLLFLVSLFILQALISIIKSKIFHKANGFYKHGIILNNGPIGWDKIHSYKKISAGKISFLNSEGIRFDTPDLENIDIIESFLQSKGVPLES